MGLITPQSMQLSWIKTYRGTSSLIQFDDEDLLPQVTTEGVYMVYTVGNPGVTIYVGKGVVSQRVYERRKDPRIKPHRALGTFYLTYAPVPFGRQANVEAYLARVFAPKVGERWPAVQEIAVNSPFAA